MAAYATLDNSSRRRAGQASRTEPYWVRFGAAPSPR